MIVHLSKEVHLTYPDWTINEGLTLFTGPSGSGKTSLLKALHGELDAVGTPTGSRSALMTQSALWIPYLTMKEQIETFGTHTATAIVKRLGLTSHEGKYPHQLSIGQLQRFSFALTLGQEKDIYLLDEPTSALDDDLTEIVCQELDEFLKTHPQASVIAVTHDVRMKSYFKTSNVWAL